MRRVASIASFNGAPFTGSAGTFYLPTTQNTFYQYLSAAGGIIEGPNAYVGLMAEGIEIDAGVLFAKANSKLPNRWEAFIRINDGLPRARGGYILPGNFLRVIADNGRNSYIYSDSELGNDAALSFSVDPPRHVCSLVVYGTDEYGFYYAQQYVASAKGISFNRKNSLKNLRMKRLVTIAQQNAPTTASYTAFYNPTPPPSATSGYVPTGSYINFIGWQSGQLFQGNAETDWTNSVTDMTDPRFTYRSPQAVTLSPAGGDAQNEKITIRH